MPFVGSLQMTFHLEEAYGRQNQKGMIDCNPNNILFMYHMVQNTNLSKEVEYSALLKKE